MDILILQLIDFVYSKFLQNPQKHSWELYWTYSFQFCCANYRTLLILSLQVSSNQ